MADKTCQFCAHSRELKITLKDTVRECREGPPQAAYAVMGSPSGAPQGIQPLGIVPRIVPDGYSCGRFQSKPSDVQ